MRFSLLNIPGVLLCYVIASITIVPSPTAFACFNIPHQWVMLKHIEPTPAEGFFGLMNALLAWRKEIQPRLGTDPAALPSLRVVAVKDSRESSNGLTASGTVDRLGKALDCIWPGRSGQPPIDPVSEDGDILDIVASHPEWPEHLFATVEILRDDEESFNFLDLIFSEWVLLREVGQANTSLIVKTVDRSGQIVTLAEKTMSPKLLLDTWIGPAGCYLTYLEKLDQNPKVFNFCEALKNVSATSCSSPAVSGSPTLNLLSADLPSSPTMQLPTKQVAGERGSD